MTYGFSNHRQLSVSGQSQLKSYLAPFCHIHFWCSHMKDRTECSNLNFVCNMQSKIVQATIESRFVCDQAKHLELDLIVDDSIDFVCNRLVSCRSHWVWSSRVVLMAFANYDGLHWCIWLFHVTEHLIICGTKSARIFHSIALIPDSLAVLLNQIYTIYSLLLVL